MRILVSAPLVCVLLAACATPQEACIGQANRDIRVLDRLIGETERDLARGYAIEDEVRHYRVWRPCVIEPATETTERRVEWCFAHEERVISREVAIDIPAETRKVAAMKQKRAELARAATAKIAECRALYPE